MEDKKTTDEYPRELSPSIKLTKNTKGYGWEIRILSTDVNEIEKIDNEMKERFGQDEI